MLTTWANIMQTSLGQEPPLKANGCVLCIHFYAEGIYICICLNEPYFFPPSTDRFHCFTLQGLTREDQ